MNGVGLASDGEESADFFLLLSITRKIVIGYSTVFCKIRDFICTSLRSTEIVLDERLRVQCDFC